MTLKIINKLININLNKLPNGNDKDKDIIR